MEINMEEEIKMLLDDKSIAKGGEEEEESKEEGADNHVLMQASRSFEQTQVFIDKMRTNFVSLMAGAEDLDEALISFFSEEFISTRSVKYELIIELGFAGEEEPVMALKKKVAALATESTPDHKFVDR